MGTFEKFLNTQAGDTISALGFNNNLTHYVSNEWCDYKEWQSVLQLPQC